MSRSCCTSSCCILLKIVLAPSALPTTHMLQYHGNPSDHISRWHFVEHPPSILHAPTFGIHINQAILTTTSNYFFMSPPASSGVHKLERALEQKWILLGVMPYCCICWKNSIAFACCPALKISCKSSIIPWKTVELHSPRFHCRHARVHLVSSYVWNPGILHSPALSCNPITSKSGIKSRRDVTSLLLWSYRHNIPPALNQWVYPPPPMLGDACMFRFMIIFALCFMMGTGHRQGTIQKCQGWIWLPPGLMPLHFGNAPSLRLYHTITLAIFNRGPGQDLDFNWNHGTNLQKYLQRHWDLLHTNYISIIPYRSTWNCHCWRSQSQKHQTEISLGYKNLM